MYITLPCWLWLYYLGCWIEFAIVNIMSFVCYHAAGIISNPHDQTWMVEEGQIINLPRPWKCYYCFACSPCMCAKRSWFLSPWQYGLYEAKWLGGLIKGACKGQTEHMYELQLADAIKCGSLWELQMDCIQLAATEIINLGRLSSVVFFYRMLLSSPLCP